MDEEVSQEELLVRCRRALLLFPAKMLGQESWMTVDLTSADMKLKISPLGLSLIYSHSLNDLVLVF